MDVLVVCDSPVRQHRAPRPRDRRGTWPACHGHGDLSNRCPTATPDGLDLLVVGGPNPRLRHLRRAARRAHHLGPAGGVNAVAFDSRYELPWVLTGSAARGIDHRLRRRGFRLVRRPESFFVARRPEEPLLPGEEGGGRQRAGSRAGSG